MVGNGASRLFEQLGADGKNLRFTGQVTDNAKPLPPLGDLYGRLY